MMDKLGKIFLFLVYNWIKLKRSIENAKRFKKSCRHSQEGLASDAATLNHVWFVVNTGNAELYLT